MTDFWGQWQDQSLRLWNVLSKVCLLVIGGSDGHRNEVLSVVCSYLMYFIVKTGKQAVVSIVLKGVIVLHDKQIQGQNLRLVCLILNIDICML